MNFIDDVVLNVTAGDGGDGLVHLRHEKYNPKGGPDGGDGGRGGSIWLEATTRRQTLAHVAGLKHVRADSGQNGGVNRRSGAAGEDITIDVPIGTIAVEAETKQALFDLTQDGQRVCIAKGGLGGRGNWHFRSSTNQTPEESEEGTTGEQRMVQLTLKLMADIGLVGQPNAGKSTLINVLTNAKSKVGAYPFTTTDPHLGVLNTKAGDIIIADIPGLIEGAAEGKGLGHQFLKHIERTRIVTYLIPADSVDPVAELRGLQKELASYSNHLKKLAYVVVLSKIDTVETYKKVALKLSKNATTVIPLSAHTHHGLPKLVTVWQTMLDSRKQSV